MGNCGSNPKTNEAVPEPVTEEVKVEQKEHSSEANVVETKKDETPNDSENKSLGTLLNEKVEQAPKTEEEKAEPKPEEPNREEVKVQEEKSKAEEAKTEA